MANYVHQRLKHTLACRRPNEYSAQIQPMILTPSHGALPSGHATEAFITALVLLRLISGAAPVGSPYRENQWAAQLMGLASRVAINRTVAGVHFPIDSVAGCILGLTLGEYFYRRCTYAGAALAGYDEWTFNSDNFPPTAGPSVSAATRDFHWNEMFDVATSAQTEAGQVVVGKYAKKGATNTFVASDRSVVLNELWRLATTEWPPA